MSIPEDVMAHYRFLISEYLDQIISFVESFPKYAAKYADFVHYACFEEILKEKGRYYLPVEEAAYPFKRKQRNPDARWANAFRAASDELLYTEGLVILEGNPVPFEHAWLTDINTGKVVDPSWRELGQVYFGIAFQKDFVEKRLAKAGEVGFFQEDDEDENARPPEIIMNGLPQGSVWTGE